MNFGGCFNGPATPESPGFQRNDFIEKGRSR
jgi:hypothetical protein